MPSMGAATQVSGAPLSAELRRYFEPRFGYDFSAVRLHHDGAAAAAAQAVHARAYTRGRDVVFDHGEYRPDTAAGRHLLAHELAHVVQQGVARPGAALQARPGTLLSGTSVRIARKSAGYKTGELKGKDGWTFVAYRDQGFARLAFRVLDSTPDRRIGNVGWVANNPGSLDLSTPTIVDPSDPAKIKRIPAPPGARVAVKEGAYEKNVDDIPTYRRFAVFPTLAAGQQAIYPMLQVIAKNNGSPTVDGLLRVYVRGVLKKGEPDPLGDNYVREIRTVMKPLMRQLDEVVQPDASEQDHNSNAGSMTEGLMGKPFLEIHPASEQARILQESILKVESTRDMARIGLEYACGKGFRNEAEARAAYAGMAGKLAQIDAIVNSADVAKQLDAVLGCDEASRA